MQRIAVLFLFGSMSIVGVKNPESDYLKMKNFITENESNLDLTIKNAHLEMENNSLREENKLLKNVIKQVSDFIERHNLPEPIKRGVKEIIDTLQSKRTSRGIHR